MEGYNTNTNITHYKQEAISEQQHYNPETVCTLHNESTSLKTSLCLSVMTLLCLLQKYDFSEDLGFSRW
jgi:hypothetical protein